MTQEDGNTLEFLIWFSLTNKQGSGGINEAKDKSKDLPPDLVPRA
jgi:hypothetical protein